jgi:hypothetical protein
MQPRPDLVRGLITDAPIVGASWRPVSAYLVTREEHIRPGIVAIQNHSLLPALLQLHQLLYNKDDRGVLDAFHASVQSLAGDPTHARARVYFTQAEMAFTNGTRFALDRRLVDGRLTLAAQVHVHLLREDLIDELDIFRTALGASPLSKGALRLARWRIKTAQVTDSGLMLFRHLKDPLTRAAARRSGRPLRPHRTGPVQNRPDTSSNVVTHLWRR